MPVVRYTADGGHYRVAGHGFDPGDERDVDNDLASYLADHDDFELVDDDAGDGAEPGDDVHEEDGPPDEADPGNLTVGELEEMLAHVQDADRVREIREREADGDGRTTALDAIDDRLRELKEA